MLVLRQDVEAEPRPRVPHVRPPHVPDLQEEAHAQARAQGVGVQGRGLVEGDWGVGGM